MAVERYELKCIGNYADYNNSGGQTSWYLLIDDMMYLFDVPFSNVNWLFSKQGKEVMDKVDNIAIFTTSTKESRINGLKTFIDIIVDMGLKHILYFPSQILLKGSNYIEIVGGLLSECHVVQGDYYQDKNVQIFPSEVAHDGIIKSFAYLIYGGDLFINQTGTNWSTYYSPDNRIFLNDDILASFLADPKEKTIYHCITTNIDDETHCYRDRVNKAVPKELRSHIYPINIDDKSDIKKLRNQGYNI